jgi:hypothetical protein
MDHQEMSKKGGSVKSEAKTKAARKNARKPRGKWVTAVYYKYQVLDSAEKRDGILLIPGKPPKADDKFFVWVEKVLTEDPINAKYPYGELLDFSTRSGLI